MSKTQKDIKIAVIGAGNVGASAVHYIAKKLPENGKSEVVLLDVVPSLAEQKGKDFRYASEYFSYHANVRGSTDFAALQDADVVVHTAGIARKPGMDRMDLLKTNVKIARDVAHNVARYAPQALFFVVANPLDVISMVCYKESGFNRNKVIGMAGILDGARYRYFIAEKLNIMPSQVQTMVLGGHGDAMVPMRAYSSISGIEATKLITTSDISAMEERTCHGGAEIVKYLKTGSAYYAPAASTADMIESLLLNERRVIPASVLLEGEYGIRDVFLGVPIILGPNGIEKIIEVPLRDDEKSALQASVAMVQSGLAQLKNI